MRLRQFDPTQRRSSYEETLIDEAFRILLCTSADVARNSEPTVYQFQDKCLYFATIHEDGIDNLGGSGGDGQTTSADDGRYTTTYTSGGVQRRHRIPNVPPSPWPPQTQPNVSRQAWDVTAASEPFGLAPSENMNILDEDVAMLGDNHVRWEPVAAPDGHTQTLAGIIYFLMHPTHSSEVSLGLALLPTHTNKGIGPRAVLKALKTAFDEFAFHRVSAAIIDGPSREPAMQMFIALGFEHEGVHRRAVMSSGPGQCENTWRDVHNLAFLDTDWAMCGGAIPLTHMLDVHTAFKAKAQAKPMVSTNGVESESEDEQVSVKGKVKVIRKRTRWDEMMLRHQREREELIGFEERGRVLRRTLSTETLRPGAAIDSAANTSASEAETSDAESNNAGNNEGSRASPVPTTFTNHDQDPFASPEDPVQETLSQHSNGPRRQFLFGSELTSAQEMVASWRASMYSATHVRQDESDVESESEMHALLPGSRRPLLRRSMLERLSDQDRASFGQRNYTIPPQDSDAQSVASTSPSAPESSVDQYTSCEEVESSEEDEEDNAASEAEPDVNHHTSLSFGLGSDIAVGQHDLSSSTVISRLPSGLPASGSLSKYTSEIPDPLLGLLPSPKRRRIGEAGTSINPVAVEAPASSASQVVPNAYDTPAPLDGPTPIAGPSSLPQQVQNQDVVPPSLSYRLSMTEIRNPPEDTMDSDAELEQTWDILSSASESESTMSSAASLSLQSASDIETNTDSE